AGKPGTLGRIGDLELGLLGDRAQARRDRALEWLGRRFLGRDLALEIRGHRETRWPAWSEAQSGARSRIPLRSTRGYIVFSSARRSPTIRATPRRSSVGKTRQRSAAPAR